LFPQPLKRNIERRNREYANQEGEDHAAEHGANVAARKL
jgi:hypothetical protein